MLIFNKLHNLRKLNNIKKNAALSYHAEGRPGKIEVVPTKPYSTQVDLSLAYSPGVAEPCLAIADNAAAYKYTVKGNLVAVISNGTAVLGPAVHCAWSVSVEDAYAHLPLASV